MKTKNILLILGILLAAWIGIGSQIPTILPVSPVTEFVDFLKGMRATGPLEVGPVGRNLKTWWDFEDFIFNQPNGGGTGKWVPTGSGTSAGAVPDLSTAARPGIIILNTGTTSTGAAAISTGGLYNPIQFLFGAGVYTFEADIYVWLLSTVTETYALRCGFGDSTSADFVDGAYFEYSDAGSTPNWYRCTASNSTRTKTDTGVAAVAGAWTRLKVVVNAAGTSVEYFINGTSVGSNTTNIPTGTGRETGAVLHLIKSVGTTYRILYIDWVWIHADLSVSR